MLAQYSALSSTSTRADVQRALSSVINGEHGHTTLRLLVFSLTFGFFVNPHALASPLSSTAQDRYKLVQLLLDDVKRCIETERQGRLSKKGAIELLDDFVLRFSNYISYTDARQALLALKTLGREPGCSRILSSESVCQHRLLGNNGHSPHVGGGANRISGSCLLRRQYCDHPIQMLQMKLCVVLPMPSYSSILHGIRGRMSAAYIV